MGWMTDSGKPPVASAGPAPLRPLPRRKAPGRGKGWQVLTAQGWLSEDDAIASGIPLAEPIPAHVPSPVTVRHVEPEVPMVTVTQVPAEAIDQPPEPQVPVAASRVPSERQLRAWEAYHRCGGQSPAGRQLGWSQGNVRSALLGYMDAMGLEGPIPPADPSLVAPATAEVTEEPAPIDAPAVVDPGADHAPDIPEIIPTRPGGGRGTDGDDFLSRLERELDRLAREDAALVGQARAIVEQRTEVARRIEEVRVARSVFHRVMAEA